MGPLSSFRRFTEWYVGHLADEEVEEALTLSPLPVEKDGKPSKDLRESSPDEKRRALQNLWNHRKAGLLISQFFSDLHADALDAIKGVSLTEIDASLPDLIAKFGVRAVVFALFIGSTKYHREIGARIMKEYPPAKHRVKESAETRTDASIVPTGDEDSPVGAASEPEVAASTEAGPAKGEDGADVVSAFELLLSKLEKNSADLPVHKLEPLVRRMNLAWDRIKAVHSRRSRVRGQVAECITRLREKFSDEQMAFWGVQDMLQSLSESADNLQMRDTPLVCAKLEELGSLLSRAVQLREKQLKATNAQELFEATAESNTIQQSLDEIRTWLLERVEPGRQTADADAEKKPALGAREDEPESFAPETAPAEGDEAEEEHDDAEVTSRQAEQEPATTTAAPTTESAADEAGVVVVDRPAADPEPGADGLESAAAARSETISLIDGQAAGNRTATGSPSAADVAVADQVEQAESRSEAPGDDVLSKARQQTEYYEKLIANALSEGDFGMAYWLAREFESRADDAVLRHARHVPPSWSLLALTMGVNNEWNTSDLVKNWLQMALEHPKAYTELSDAGRLSPKVRAYLVSLAAMRPALFAPETGATDWLQDVSASLSDQTEPLHGLIQAVTQFALRGHPLELPAAKNAKGPWQIRLQELRSHVEQWRKEMTLSRVPYEIASRASTRLAHSEGPLGEVLEAVRSDAVDHITARRLVLDHLGDRSDFTTVIQEATRQVAKGPGRVPNIVGRARRHLNVRLERLQELLYEWVDILAARDSSREDWYHAAVDELLAAFLEHWPEVDAELRGLGGGSSAVERALVAAAQEGLAELAQQLKDPSSVAKQPRSWLAALRRPLLLLETPPLDQDGLPLRDADGQPHLDDDLLKKRVVSQRVIEGATLESAFQSHIERREFRTAALVLDELVADGLDDTALAEQLQDAWLEAAASLKRHVARTREKVEQSYIEHVLSEEQKSEFDAMLLHIEDKLAGAEAEINLGAHFKELAVIEDRLEETRAARIHSIQTSIDEHLADGSELVPQAQHFIQLAKQALEEGDIPVADEYMSYAEMAQAGADPQTFQPPKFENIVPEFVAAMDLISNALQAAQDRHQPQAVMERLAEGRSIPGIPMNRVPGSRRKEVRDGLSAYYALKRRRPATPERLTRELQRLLEYIGFRVSSVALKNHGRESLHFQARMSAGFQSPLAEFGSLRRGVYDVVVFYGRPTATMMGEELRRYMVTENRPIIIHAGRMTPLHREEWSMYCWENRLTALLLDEVLLHFLAGQRETRLPAAVSCGVAWGYCMPYRSFGDIPPELFKGRHALVSDIAGPRRTGIVYGGRQFGKTALLRTVERLAHHPENRTFVIFEDIKHLGHPSGQDQPERLWIHIRDRLAEHGIVNKSLRKTESIIDEIVAAVDEDPSLRIILLLDEADYFLNADARNQYRELERIRTLQDKTNDQVKFVLSGLHNVQRFYKDSNHPLAQLGGAIPIGPLPTHGARALIQEPLYALGFTFGDDSGSDQDSGERVILRILSYTNYHPALIQHFCGELVNLVRQKRTAPPYRITMDDVESVYRKPEVQAMMKERFEWTIGLDNRYKVIVYGMIFAQLYHGNGFRKTFSAREIYEEVKTTWPEGFAHAQADDIQALLDELIGLGVLVRLDNGRYRLRNGNVVRALGTPEEIFMSLEAATKEKPEEAQDPGRFRLRLSEERRSPLIGRQVRQLTEPGSGVGIIFGSDALLGDLVEETLQTYVESVLSDTAEVELHVMPLECVDRDPMLRFVHQLYNQRGRHVVYCPSDHLLLASPDFGGILGELADQLSKWRSRRKSVRVVFSLGPSQTYRLFRSLGDDYASLEAKIVPITIPLWDASAVRRFFVDETPGLPYTLQKVMDVTGGWPYWIERIRHALHGDGPDGDTSTADAVVQRLENLQTLDNPLRDEFLKALGVHDIPLALSILRLLKELGPVTWSDVDELPEISDDPSVRQAPGVDVAAATNALVRLQMLNETTDGLVVNDLVARAISDAEH